MLEFYLDDSGTHRGSKAAVWGGVVGYAEYFDELESKWREMLACPCEGRPPIKQFHSSHLAAGKGEFMGYSDAERDLSEADSLDSLKRAPYEYTRAKSLLEKAKELEGYGAYESAGSFARQSRTMSEKAIDVARLAAEREKRDEKFGVRKSRKPDADGEKAEGGQ